MKIIWSFFFSIIISFPSFCQDNSIDTTLIEDNSRLVRNVVGFAPSKANQINGWAIVEFDNRMEKRIATMKVEGRPFGHSAMSRAVGLPAAIASRLILEGAIRSKGVLKPITEEIYKPILAELAENGYKFEHKTQVI